MATVLTLIENAHDLDGFEGAPFSDEALRVASANIRGIAGWHIAPEVTETLTVESDGGRYLFLPTARIVEVTAVRDVAGDTPRELTGWRIKRDAAGVLIGYWPCGVIEVDVTHGHAETPADLLPVIAAECRTHSRDRAVVSRSRGPFSESYRDEAPTVDPTLARYILPPRP